MGVNDRHVGPAKRIREASPARFEEVRAGEVALWAAIRRLDGITDDARASERCRRGCIPAQGRSRSTGDALGMGATAEHAL